ncbi:CcdC family protein [Heyndrickxia ginsengihumi]|uniref:Cytochrome c biogenesis protein CcdC n=1 Tax=Heyndrickxia ginsengihumi TaxID=363870 RepID=A0A0A6VD27_9BACI|nr:cytochrome c biogenesis protein CcdC [Heyndrickxia ginsengihumi]KHD85378.1 membrane protein [Heyndrickxia ginsengihumi]MBE6183122.1 cytochrome c biogenesis protein CcdC [Bacillus sp. (in: firmicutes)]MCM3024225.1 cytochrome c biogenesis protein CcdC [Heyndrickxia ginsengihumi]NEY20581.1 cytochrome c biogenesis protein CcdC [Heyndrickxia ginsengihumi]
MEEIIISFIIAILMGSLVIFIRLKGQKRPVVSAKKLILPPFFMSTGALMFIFPFFRVTSEEILESILIGLVFSIFLIKTSKFEIRDHQIYLKRSKAFPFILIGLLIIRLVMKLILSSSIHVGQLSGMFFILAFAMILPWRVAMYIEYKKLLSKLNPEVKM